LELLGILPLNVGNLSVDLSRDKQPVHEPGEHHRRHDSSRHLELVPTMTPPSFWSYRDLTPGSYVIVMTFKCLFWVIAKSTRPALRYVYALCLSFSLACTVFALAVNGSLLLPAVFADPVGAGPRLAQAISVSNGRSGVWVGDTIDHTLPLRSTTLGAFKVPTLLGSRSAGVTAPAVLNEPGLPAHGLALLACQSSAASSSGAHFR
jgi:hypothetical protein